MASASLVAILSSLLLQTITRQNDTRIKCYILWMTKNIRNIYEAANELFLLMITSFFSSSKFSVLVVNSLSGKNEHPNSLFSLCRANPAVKLKLLIKR